MWILRRFFSVMQTSPARNVANWVEGMGLPDGRMKQASGSEFAASHSPVLSSAKVLSSP